MNFKQLINHYESLDKKENNQKDGKYLRPIAVNA